ncbi:transglutaminase-like cysteine peptidase [Pararhizobium haloflavum]|uniref:transglutaminase-like cysteine peptidase n=1 Tax=Pararhizobium haloflavum TaxID=2037914 RepID=UPI000C18893B|nr:transglutaminase-like cysteine peptidase [Pararhizobium haloflavum]
MKKTTTTIAALAMACALLGLGGAASAAPANMVTANQTSQPIGHHEFCRANAAECGRSASGPTAPGTLTREKWAVLLDVNVTVNRAVQPLTDMEIHGREEVWSYPSVVGDCEDYVLLKRKMLMERGFAASDLLITVVLQPDGLGHAVLTVRTDHGDFILDNMRDRVLLWSDTEYTFLKRQSSEHAGMWKAINDSRDPMAVGSVR